ncbi:MAG: cyclic nucleotide-binding domain-containing protein [Gammaproteobacteria bacterium]|nr:cyclic nucleotide-binding domain-containing protein [Gammaproteobacteria bacterium]
MVAKAQAFEAGQHGVEASLLRRFVPMNGLADTHLAQLVPFAGLSDLHPGDSIPTNFKTSDQAYYVVEGELELYAASQRVGSVRGGTEEARFPLSHLRQEFDSARAREAVRLLRVDRARVSALLILEEPSAGATTHRRATRSPLDSRQIIAQLLKSQIFSHIPPANVQRLLELAEPVEVHAGDVIIRQGERGNYCYILMKGRCSVTRRAEGELMPRMLGELGPGDSFGEEVLGRSGVRRSTVTMATDGWLRRLSKAQFVKLSGKSGAKTLAWGEARALAERGARWLDVRLGDEHRNDGLPGSINLPLAELGARSRELDRKVTYILCCNTGQRSIAAATLLREQGFSVCVLEDGLMGRDARGGGNGAVDDLRAQMVLIDAEIRTAMERKAEAEAARETASIDRTLSDSDRVRARARADAEAARATEALVSAKRRKLELEAMVRAMETREASERQQAESVVEQLRQQTDVRLRQEKDRLQHEYLQAAGAMDDLKRAQEEAEQHFQKERERLEAQIAQARAAMSVEAERIRNEVESAKRAAAEKAEKIRREQAIAEQQLRARTEARLLAERRKLESEFADTMNTVRQANQDLSSAKNAKADAQRKADEVAAKLREAEERARRGGGTPISRQEASRRLEAAHRAQQGRAARPSNVVPFKGPGAEDETFDPTSTMVALRTELHSFEDKVSEASDRIDAASRARAQAQRAQLLVEERLAHQKALEEETRLTLYEEAESWLADERSRESSASKDKERERAKAKAEEMKRQAKASEDLMTDIRSQLSGDFDDGASSIEHSLRMRELEQAGSASKPAPNPEREKASDERKKAKEALDRAREHVQRLKDRFQKD